MDWGKTMQPHARPIFYVADNNQSDIKLDGMQHAKVAGANHCIYDKLHHLPLGSFRQPRQV
jgi:hypothetical protein